MSRGLRCVAEAGKPIKSRERAAAPQQVQSKCFNSQFRTIFSDKLRILVMKELFRLVFLLLSLCSFGYAQNCYYEGGVSATDYSYKPCSTTAASPCCIPGESDVCLSSGMCYYPEKNYFYRGACTDETWSDEGNCPQYCLTGMLFHHMCLNFS